MRSVNRGYPIQHFNLASSVVGVAILCTAACSNLTAVSAPDITQPSDLDTPQGAIARAAGATRAFAGAFGLQVFTAGLISDELSDLSGSSQADRRKLSLQLGEYPYQGLSTARMSALRAISSLQAYQRQPLSNIGELFADVGIVEILFAENMCSGVPLGQYQGQTPIYGVPETRSQLIQQGLMDLDSAVAYAGASDSILNLVRVIRGRALLDSNDFAAAARAVDSVPGTFVYLVDYAPGGGAQTNAIAQEISIANSATVSDNEGLNGLPFISGNDPRVSVVQVGTSASGVPIFNYTPDSVPASPLILASGIEAQLITAEADLRAGNVQQWSSILNSLRATAASVPLQPLPADSTTSAAAELRTTVHFRERAFWLFLTGHRHGDMRRLIRQFGRPTESVFPTGLYEGGPSQYGASTVFFPVGEQFNPHFTNCENVSP